MNSAIAILGRRAGPIMPTGSSGSSEFAERLAKLVDDVRRHIWQSYTVRRASDRPLDELEDVRLEASQPGWNGYGAAPINPEAYENARSFLESLPPSAPPPEVSVDPDGDVSLDWMFGERRALSVSLGRAGRCTFAWMRGRRTYRGTEWLDDGIPAPVAEALWQLAREAGQAGRFADR
jgi:hypothetical protein